MEQNMDVKIEYDISNLCHGCLSSERKLSYISEELCDIFNKLRNDDEYQKQCQRLVLCWECVAFIKKLKTFQTKIKTAQELLLQYLESYYIKVDDTKGLQCLSALKCEHKNSYNNEFCEETNFSNKEKEDLPDDKGKDRLKDEQNSVNSGQNVDLIIELKQECNIKEENNSNDSHDTEFKIENEDSYIDSDNTDNAKICRISVIPKIYNKNKYNKYVIITENSNILVENYVQYSTSYITQDDYESLFEKERIQFGNLMKFKCSDCEKSYFKKLDLLRHASFIHKDKLSFPCKCAACKVIITSADHLEQHWTAAHTVLKKCTLCPEICRSFGGIKRHLKKVHKKTFTCKKCTEQFGCMYKFVNHYKLVHDQFICDYCGCHCKSKRSMISHLKKYHIPGFCKECNRSYKNHKKLEHHRRLMHPDVTREEALKDLSYCVECDKQYPSILKYQRHLKDSVRHRPRKKIRVPCPECGKIFTKTTFMKNHYNFAHLKKTKNYCDTCDKYYTTGYGLRKHIEGFHNNIPKPKDKICDMCGRGFATNRILANHRRTHTGERPYKCPHCPAAFAQLYAMKTHERTQHKNIILDTTS